MYANLPSPRATVHPLARVSAISQSAIRTPRLARPRGVARVRAVIDATNIIEDYRRLSASSAKRFFLISTSFWIFFATPDRAQREQPIGGLNKFVRARVRSAWRVKV